MCSGQPANVEEGLLTHFRMMGEISRDSQAAGKTIVKTGREG